MHLDNGWNSELAVANIEKTLKILATDQIQAEQYMDFLRNRMFRQTLLCHEGVALSIGVTPDRLLEAMEKRARDERKR